MAFFGVIVSLVDFLVYWKSLLNRGVPFITLPTFSLRNPEGFGSLGTFL